MGHGGTRITMTLTRPNGREEPGRHRGDLDALRQIGVARRYAAGDVVFRQGEDGTTVYLVESGVIRSTLDTGGQPVAISAAGPGDLLGAVDPIAGEPRSATATAATDACVVAVPGATFLDVIDRDPHLRRTLLRQMSAELSTAHSRLVSLCLQNAVGRVAATLLALSDEGSKQTVRTTQSDLAEWIGATRESTARALGELRQRGFITTGRGWIRLDDADALADLAAC